MTNPPSDFLKFVGTPFERHILPIIPVGARLTADSSLTADQLGKIPGKYFPLVGKWAGFCAWQKHIATRQHLKRWQHWQVPDMAGGADSHWPANRRISSSRHR
jgi:hypothetical protein